MTVRFVIVAEDELGQQLTRDIADRVVGERAHAIWLRDAFPADEATKRFQRTHGGLEPETRWSKWIDVKRLAEKHSIRVHGLGMKAHRLIAHKAVAVAAALNSQSPKSEPIAALFLVHDTDGERDVAVQLRRGARGRDAEPPSFAVVVAAPHPESEAWVVAGQGRRRPGSAPGWASIR